MKRLKKLKLLKRGADALTKGSGLSRVLLALWLLLGCSAGVMWGMLFALSKKVSKVAAFASVVTFCAAFLPLSRFFLDKGGKEPQKV